MHGSMEAAPTEHSLLTPGILGSLVLATVMASLSFASPRVVAGQVALTTWGLIEARATAEPSPTVRDEPGFGLLGAGNIVLDAHAEEHNALQDAEARASTRIEVVARGANGPGWAEGFDISARMSAATSARNDDLGNTASGEAGGFANFRIDVDAATSYSLSIEGSGFIEQSEWTFRKFDPATGDWPTILPSTLPTARDGVLTPGSYLFSFDLNLGSGVLRNLAGEPVFEDPPREAGYTANLRLNHVPVPETVPTLGAFGAGVILTLGFGCNHRRCLWRG